MTQLGRYCKAYLLKEFRQFGNWAEQSENALPASESSDADPAPRLLGDDDILYLHDTYVVTDGVYADEHIIFDAVTSEWMRYCGECLGFVVPDYDSEMPLDDEAASEHNPA